MNHLNRCKTSTFVDGCQIPKYRFHFSCRPTVLLITMFSRGTQHFTGTVSNEATSEMGYPVWPTGRTCSVCQLSSTWQRAKPRTLLTNLFVFDDLVQVFFPVVAIWTHVYWDFTFSQNRVLNRLLQVSEVSLYLLWRNDI